MGIASIAWALLLAVSLPPERADGQTLFSFADHLFESGDYYRAITEYERFIFHYPQDPGVPRARLRIGLSYQRGGKWGQAEEELEGVIRDYKGTDTEVLAQWELGETFYQSGRFLRAAAQYKKFSGDFSNANLSRRAPMRIAWCYVRTGEYTDAEAALSQMDKVNPSYDLSRGFLREIEGLGRLPRKSPALAGSLSAVVPGTGQFYAGRYMDGAAALLLNAAFVFGAVEAFTHKLYGTFGILLFFETGWYGGNIYSAVSSTYKYNRTREENALHTLERKYWEP